MKLTVIGSGSKGNCYILRDSEEALIIECGVPFDEVKKAMNYDLKTVCGILVTHEHKDHCKGVPDALTAGQEVFATKGTIDGLGIKSHRLNVITINVPFYVGNFKVIPFKVMHDAKEPCGFFINHTKIGNLLFITDTYYVPNRFANVNNIMIESNYCDKIIDSKEKTNRFVRDRVIQSHMSLKTCKEFLAANDLTKVNNIVLIHLSDSNSDARRFKKEISELTGKNVSIAESGLTFDIGITPY
jgi:phosphoribosyl 1,2-cyclic phosphodiesterase